MIDIENPPVYTSEAEFNEHLTNPQNMFDYVMAHIIKQGGPSTNASGSCKYRGSFERKCAAGHILPDHVFTQRPNTSDVALICLVGHPDYAKRQAWRQRIAERVHQTALVVADHHPSIFIDEPRWTYLRENIELAIRLQVIHDSASVNVYTPETWYEKLYAELNRFEEYLTVDISRIYTHLRHLTGRDFGDRIAP